MPPCKWSRNEAVSSGLLSGDVNNLSMLQIIQSLYLRPSHEKLLKNRYNNYDVPFTHEFIDIIKVTTLPQLSRNKNIRTRAL